MLSGITQVTPIEYDGGTIAIELGPPSAELEEVARKELRESPELQKESMARLRELLKGKGA